MRCLYDVLGVERFCEENAIRAAYRRGALEWHPDKNQDRLEEAEERFRELQNAYEVLSDKHERAWYDSHRDAILRSGSTHQAGSEAVPTATRDLVDLFAYFSSGCFSGYTDGTRGFYTVYRSVFEQLARQELDAFEQGSGKTRQPPTFPSFGASDAGAKEVSDFYNFWQNFVTDHTFDWADQFNLAAAPNRPVRRRMEEENRKARKAARRDFNDNVRELASFVRRRDKRVSFFQAQQAQRKIEAEEREQQRREAERQRRLEEMRQYEEALAAQAQANGADQHDSGASEEEDAVQQADKLFCVACDKSFRSEGAFRNHERSKKHQERAESLRLQLEEEAALALDEHSEGSVEEEGSAEDDSASEEGDLGSTQRRQSADAEHGPETAHADDSGTSTSGKGSQYTASDPDNDESIVEDDEGDEDQMLQRMLRSHGAGRHRKPGKHKAAASAAEADHVAGQLASDLDVSVREQPDLLNQQPQDATPMSSTAQSEGGSDSTPATSQAPPEATADAAPALSNKQRQKANRRAKQLGTLKDQLADRTTCLMCKKHFDSRNALFSHLERCRGLVGSKATRGQARS